MPLPFHSQFLQGQIGADGHCRHIAPVGAQVLEPHHGQGICHGTGRHQPDAFIEPVPSSGGVVHGYALAQAAVQLSDADVPVEQ